MVPFTSSKYLCFSLDVFLVIWAHKPTNSFLWQVSIPGHPPPKAFPNNVHMWWHTAWLGWQKKGPLFFSGHHNLPSLPSPTTPSVSFFQTKLLWMFGIYNCYFDDGLNAWRQLRREVCIPGGGCSSLFIGRLLYKETYKMSHRRNKCP